nr:hypothetical protein [Tanacetum cinerariifolium]
MTSTTSLCEMACEFVQKKLEEKQLEEERAAKAQNWKLPVCYDDHHNEERSDSLYDNIIFGLPLFFAITPDGPVLSIEEPDNSLKFSSTDDDSFSFDKIDYVEASPPDSELVSSETKSSSTSLNSLLEETNNFDNSLPEFKTFSNVLCDAEYESDSSDDQSCSDEDIDSLLEEFAGELTLLKSILPGVDETDYDFKEDIRLIEKLLYDNSSPRPPEEFVSANSDAKTKSFSPSPILVKDSDFLMEEIDLFCTPDYPMPPGIVDKDYESERDILILRTCLAIIPFHLLK